MNTKKRFFMKPSAGMAIRFAAICGMMIAGGGKFICPEKCMTFI